ncbi:HAMP domain-containing protein, partial [Oligoflexus tunisiensis]
MIFGIRNRFHTRIFIFVVLLVVLVVAFITGRNILNIHDSLSRQYRKTLIDGTQLVGLRMNGLLNRWETKITLFSHVLLRAPQEMRSHLIDSFIKSEAGVVAVQIIQLAEEPVILASGMTDPGLTLDTVGLSEVMKTADNSIQHHPTDPSLGVFMRTIAVEDGTDPVGVLLYFKLKALIQDNQPSDSVEIYLLNHDFYDILQQRSYGDLIKQNKFAALTQSRMKRKGSSGYLGELSMDGERVFVAFHQLPAYPLYVLVHLNGSAIENAILSFIIEMLQWTVLFVLCAILCARWITSNLLQNLRELHAATQRAVAGNFGQLIRVRSRDEIGELAASFNIMSNKLVELLTREREKTRLSQALSTAQTVQNTFFKDTRIRNGRLNITSFYKPASECGGDWWGRFSLSHGKELILIGDATGHGVPAALVTAMAYTAAHTHIQRIREGGHSED